MIPPVRRTCRGVAQASPPPRHSVLMSDCHRPVPAVAPNVTSFRRSYPGQLAHVGQARRDVAAFVTGCPVADDVILLVSELCGNAVLHSRSGGPGGRFTVCVETRPAE